ncbi:acyltransferase family protein [Aliihoeflea sp. PC F10.4]
MHDTVKQHSDFRLAQSAELQGLRAVAVAAVFLYHFDSWLLPSGFIGVDIFFVLSGFLIGRKLLAELEETGRIKLFAFTAARAKRLLPNATLTLVATAIATWLLLPPYRFSDIASDIRSAALFFSNFRFADNAIDYLRIGSPPSPVLHFWSLSIEEQFYIGLPALLLAIGICFRGWRIRAAVILIGIIAAISFLLGWNALQTSQPSAFFETQNRIWQLAIGVLTGCFVAKCGLRIKHNQALAIAIAACAGIVWSATILTGSYPGPTALWPTLSTSIFLVAIFCGPETVLHRALRLRPVQWIGDRSYSIYLWHWPFLVIAGQSWPGNTLALWLAAAISILVAHLVYERVEQPIRAFRLRAFQAVPGVLGAISMALLASVAIPYAPLPQAAEDRLAEIERASKDFGRNYADGCHLGLTDTEIRECAYGDLESDRTVMLFGDSHAARWFEPIRLAAEEEGWRFLTRTKTSCPPADVDMWYPPRQASYDECAVWRANVMGEIAAENPDVLIVASFADYRGWIERDGRSAGIDESIALWSAGFRSMTTELPADIRLVSIRDNPQMFTNFMHCLSFGDECDRSRDDALRSMIDDRRVAAEADREIEFLDLTDYACTQTKCSPLFGDEIIYQDHHHFTSTYAGRFADTFVRLFGQDAPQ